MFRGSFVALITPFTKKGHVDEEALRELVSLQVNEGSDGILTLGTTGEAATLSEEEWKKVLAVVIDEVRGRIPVIAGTGTYSTAHTVTRTNRAKEMGASGALVVFPYYNKPEPEGLLAHFQEVNKVEFPTVAYYHPGRTGLTVSSAVLREILSLENVVALKDCSGNVSLLSELSEFSIFTGNDEMALPFLLSGACGSFSPTANIVPNLWRNFVDVAMEGEREEAYRLEARLRPLVLTLLSEINPQCFKYALSLLNLCEATLRLPLVEPRRETKRKIAAELSQIMQTAESVTSVYE